MPTYLTCAHVLDFNYSPRRSKTLELQTTFEEQDAGDAAKKLNLLSYEKELWRDYRFRLQRYAIIDIGTESGNDHMAVMLYRSNPNNTMCRFQANAASSDEVLKYFRQYLLECDPDHETIVLGPGDDDATNQQNHELLKRRA
jgi:hypothetical protein